MAVVKVVKKETPNITWSRARIFAFLKAFLIKEDPELKNDSYALEDAITILDSAMYYTEGEIDGCCAFLVIHTLSVNGVKLSDETLAKFILNLYDGVEGNKPDQGTILATTVPSQKAEIAVLKAAGFVEVLQTKNTRTRNVVTMWQADIRR